MTEKAVEIQKNKNKQPKLKNKQKKIESDSDISDSDAKGNAPKIDKKQLKLISTEVTDLLASLKKEHGIEDEPVIAAPKGKDKPSEKGNKNKKDAKNVQTIVPVATKKAKGQQAEKKLTIKQEKLKANENKKQKPVKGNVGANKETKPNVVIQPQDTKKKAKKNKKRATETVDVKTESTDEPPVKKIKQNPAQNQPKKQKQKQNKGETKPAVKKEPKVKEEETEDAEDVDDVEETEAEAVKKEHHLKTAVPVFVGNLPVNVKRIKLLKMFKKFGTILSIRFRTNTGKSFLRKAQLEKVPHLIAFLYFDTREAAEASVALNGEKIGDNVITVDLDSKEKAANIKPQNTVVVGNLRYAVTDHVLREAFKCCGQIEHIRVVQSDKGCKGVAFVRFAQPESCSLALKLNGTSILDREIRVEKYKENKSPAAKEVKKAKTPKPVLKKKLANKIAANKNATNKASPTVDGDKKKKKKKNKEFLGVKSNDAKKTKLNKKKKNKLSNEMRLAKKVAPKAEKA